MVTRSSAPGREEPLGVVVEDRAGIHDLRHARGHAGALLGGHLGPVRAAAPAPGEEARRLLEIARLEGLACGASRDDVRLVSLGRGLPRGGEDHRLDQRERRDAAGMRLGESQGDGRAEGMADDMHSVLEEVTGDRRHLVVDVAARPTARSCRGRACRARWP